MARDLAARLIIEGVGVDTKKALQEAALQRYGTPNASLLVRQLISAHLAKGLSSPTLLTPNQVGDTVRIELRIPRAALDRINMLAENQFSRRNYYLTSIILAHLGQPQLQGDEIEVLRRSNYELAKVGTNINQIAKAFNTLVQMGGSGKTPEIGKKLASLKREIKEHTTKVLRVLNSRTAIWENIGRGQVRKRKK